MGNLGNSLKKFLSNKNTVTILAVIAGVIVLWAFYNYRVNQAINTIKVPYSVEKIDTGTKIDIEKLEYKEVTVSMTKDSDIITNAQALQDKYICTGTSIPANGFFYESQVCDKEELPNSIYDDIPDGYTIYGLSVDNHTTYANSIYPGDYIDLYLKAVDDDGQVIFGKLIESIEVLAVRDSSGKDVFWDSSAGAPAELVFAVPSEAKNDEYNLYELLSVAEFITGYSINIYPVPRSANYTQNKGETTVSSEVLYNFIMSKHAETN
jgi:hypothetical protein